MNISVDVCHSETKDVAKMIRPTKKFKIGLIVNEFFCREFPPLGGFGFSAKNFAEFFNSQDDYNVEVVALLPVYKGEGNSPNRIHDTRVLVMPKDRLRRLVYYNQIRKEKFDLLVSINYYSSYFGRLISSPRTPWLHWIRDPRTQKDWDRIMELVNTKYSTEYSARSRHMNRKYGLLRTLAKVLSRDIHYGIQETWLIDQAKGGLPINNESFSRLVNRIEVPTGQIQKSAKPKVLFIGRLVPIKRPWIYFEIAKNFPDVVFGVAGEIDNKGSLRDIITEAREITNLEFYGNVTGDDLKKLMAESWIMINTSLHEAMPQSVLQVLAYETPIVSSQLFGGTIHQYGIHTGVCNGDGLVEVDAFCRAVKSLLENPAQRRALGEAGRQYVKENYTDEAFFSQFMTVLSEMKVKHKGHIFT